MLFRSVRLQAAAGAIALGAITATGKNVALMALNGISDGDTTDDVTAATVLLLGAASTQASGLPSPRLHQNIEWVERETIRKALDQAGGIKKDAAEIMGISQRALSYYLSKYRFD